MTEPTMDDAMMQDILCLMESGLSVEQVGALVNWINSDAPHTPELDNNSAI